MLNRKLTDVKQKGKSIRACENQLLIHIFPKVSTQDSIQIIKVVDTFSAQNLHIYA